MTKIEKNQTAPKDCNLNHTACDNTIYRLRQELAKTKQQVKELEAKLSRKEYKPEAFAAIRSAKKRTTSHTPTQIDKLNKYMSLIGKNELYTVYSFLVNIESIFLDANAILLRMMLEWVNYEANTRP